ncbi:MAG: GWxTD domain-containing protein, partial [Acidobacteria bacterium]|nr:GWxTD domain-containing protein [Acidobacteriota bacterium]
MRPAHTLPVVCLIIACLASPSTASRQRDKTREELAGDAYYRKWLNEDVVYIITPDERAVFEKLRTAEEKEQFIEQFWRRRDPDPMTPDNEFREEHYRLVQYANEQFYSGKAGWQTDRGRIYIRFGPPDSRHRYGPGETYVRKPSEGGGITKTHPFEIWRYAFIEGIGPDVEIEFVDPTNTGEFRMTIDPQEKDALLRAGSGPTEYEEAGLESRYLRLQRSGLATNYV